MAHFQDGGHGYAGQGMGSYSAEGQHESRNGTPNPHYQQQQQFLQQQRMHDPRLAARNNTLPPEIRPLNNQRYYGGGHQREPSLRRIASVDHNLYARRNPQHDSRVPQAYASQLSPGLGGAFPRGPPPLQPQIQQQQQPQLPHHPQQQPQNQYHHQPQPQYQQQQPQQQYPPQAPFQQQNYAARDSNTALSQDSLEDDDDYYDEDEYEGTENYQPGYVQNQPAQGGYPQPPFAQQSGYQVMPPRSGTPGTPFRTFSPVASRPGSRAGSAMGHRANTNSPRPDLPPSLIPGARVRTSGGSTMSSQGPALKMPPTLNTIARERDLALNGELYASPASSPTSSYAPSPQTPGFGEDARFPRPPNPTSSPAEQNTPSNEHMRKHLFPNATLSSLPPSLTASPHSSTYRIPSMNFSRIDGRTSFRSAITTDRSSVLSTSSGMFTVDEAIGMYGSDTDSDDEMSKMGASLTLEEQKILLEREFQKDAASVRQSLSQESSRSTRSSNVPSILDRVESTSSKRPSLPPTKENVETAAKDNVEESPKETPASPSKDNELGHKRQKSSVHTVVSPKDDRSSTGSAPPVPPSRVIPPPIPLDDDDAPPTPVKDSPRPFDRDIPPPAAKEPPKPFAKDPPRPLHTKPAEKPPRDKYGFKKQTPNVSLAEYEAWSAEYEAVQERRRVKWEALMKEAGLQIGDNGPTRFPPKSQKLKRYVRKGVPSEWRGAAWFWFAGGPSILAKNHGLYARILEGRDLSSAPDYEIIERDLHRTFPDNIHFKPDPEYTADGKPSRASKQVETPILKSLRRVLVAFSLHVPKVGYCQSLNFLAGLLLLFMDEEKAFWMLFIITQHLLPGTHDLNLGSDIDQGVLMLCIRDSLPVVWSKIGHNVDGVLSQEITEKLPPVALVTLAWFMNAFLCNLPIETALRVWDCWFYEGPKTLFRISLAILKMGESEIKNVSENGEAIQLVQNLPRKLIDATALMELCFKRRNGFGHLSQEEVDKKREERRRVHLRANRENTGRGAQTRPGSRARSKTSLSHRTMDESVSSGKRFMRGMVGKS